jgi:beta-mannosidase
LRVSLYHDFEQPVGEGSAVVEVAPHGGTAANVEELVGHFVDASWAYRFGPPAQDLVVASLEVDGEGGPRLVSQAFRFPVRRPAGVESAERLGLAAKVSAGTDDTLRLAVSSRRFAYGVRLHAPGFAPTDDAFSVEPGGTRVVDLRPLSAGNRFVGGALSAINLSGRLSVGPSADAIVPAVAAGPGVADPA